MSKTPDPEARAPLESIITTEPLELVCIDFWSAEDSSNKSLDVLVVTDHFTKLAHAFLCPNQSAKSVAHQLWNNYFCVYGMPRRIHSDQGANFESALIAELLSVAGVQKSHTTPYHPMGNGSCERMNRTLGNMIRALPTRAKHRWPQALKSLTFAYNCTIHETTGFAPFLLMFGRTPRLPVDIVFGSVIENPEVVDYDQFVQSLRRDLKEAMNAAQASAAKQLKRHADLYDRRVRGAPVEIGDRVLLANKGERGKRKLADRWEDTVYLVTGLNADSHTFKIQNSSTGREKTVHRNLIMPVNFLPLPHAAVEEGTDMSGLTESEDMNDSLVVSAAMDTAVDDGAEYRTRVWVSELSSEGTGDTSLEGDVRSLDAQDIPPLVSVDDILQLEGLPRSESLQESDRDCNSVVSELIDQSAYDIRTDLPNADHSLPDQLRTDCVDGHTIATVHNTVTPYAVEGSRGHIRSRAGRLFKPVSRLIEIMNQQKVSS